jgi:pantetheine-phosphate adenylyltransferase
MKVIVGGTFGYLHKGHKALLTRAFELGDEVCIGLTSDQYVARVKLKSITPYSKRKEELASFARQFEKKFEIVQLDDPFGPSISGDFDVIVVSRETLPAAEEINSIRASKGLRPLALIVVDYVLAYDSNPISTTRICKHEIDRDGNKLSGKMGEHE